MKTILIQLDTDPQPSSFDRVVAVDAGVDELFSYGGVTVDNVEPLVHGAMFTRGPDALKHTALFIGGSDVAAGEAVRERVNRTFFGPVRVSLMVDSNGSNTTAAAAVLAAAKHLPLSDVDALVLGGTGPVGQRVAHLLARQGATVRVASRSLERAQKTCEAVAAAVENAKVAPCATESDSSLNEVCDGVSLIVAAGAAGVEFLSEDQWSGLDALKVVIDLNAVPPAGLAGVNVMDKAHERNGVVCYGAVGVGGTKMKIHRAAVRKLFERNDLLLDTESIYEIGESLGSSQ